MIGALIDNLFVSFSIVTAVAFLMGLTYRPSARLPTRLALAWTRFVLLVGACFALITHTFEIVPGVFIDLRNVPVAVAAFTGGPLWGLGVACFVSAYRVALGGPAVPAAVVNLLLIVICASVLRTLTKQGRGPSTRPAALAIFGLSNLTLLLAFWLNGRAPLSGVPTYVLVTFVSVLGFLAWQAVTRVMANAFETLSSYRVLAYRDTLTGLLNRRAFDRDLASPREGSFLLLLDIDHFKCVNDTYGHELGDAVLRAVGRVLSEGVRRDDRVYRVGGEELALLLHDTTPEGARLVAQRVARRVTERVGGLVGRSELCPTVSGGLVPLREGAVAEADRLLYEAKAAGRDRILGPDDTHRGTGANPLLDRRSPTWTTVRSFLTFLSRDEEQEPDWAALLAAAVASVPGAHAGSLSVRGAHGSQIVAQVGFDEGLVGAVHTVENMRAWYDGPEEDWRAGLPRVRRGEDLIRLTSGHRVTDPADHVAVMEDSGRRADLQANMLFPIILDGEVAAELNLDNLASPEAFTEESVNVAEEFGMLVAALLSARARRLREARRSEELVLAREGALEALGLALEARDLETSGHTHRVMTLSRRLGEAWGLSAERMEGLRHGAYLHDLGKLRVPDRVLLKPGRLDPEEWSLMRAHAAEGFELARRMPLLSPLALDVVRHHHERWDGAGYPDGLSGEAIPLLARLFAVCDVYDALTSERPYKEAWTAEQARAEIAAQAGRQFDPDVVAVFLRTLPPCSGVVPDVARTSAPVESKAG